MGETWPWVPGPLRLLNELQVPKFNSQFAPESHDGTIPYLPPFKKMFRFLLQKNARSLCFFGTRSGICNFCFLISTLPEKKIRL